MKLNRIKEVLKERKVKQIDLAKKLGISKTAMSDLCRNRTQPSLKRLFQIAGVLGCEARELIVEGNGE